jgi:hypothetical protein
MASLASVYQNQKEYDKASELHSITLELRQKVLGPEHSRTLDTMHNLAVAWKSQGKDTEAINLMASCLQLKTKTLGANNASTESAADWLNYWQTSKIDGDNLQNSD